MESRASSRHVRPAVGLSWSWRTSSTIVVSVTRACQFWRCRLCLSHGCLRCSQDVNRRTEAVLWWQHILLTYLYLLASNFIAWNETIKGNSDKHNYWPSASSRKGMWVWRKKEGGLKVVHKGCSTCQLAAQCSLIFLHSFCPHLQWYSLTMFPLRHIQLHTAPCTTSTSP